LFSATDTAGPITYAPIFLGPASAGANAELTWLDSDTVRVSQSGTPDVGIAVGTTDGITAGNFGFYYRVLDGSPIQYSYDAMNYAFGQTQAAMLAYNAAPGSDSWLIAGDYNAWQAPGTGGLDYNDMVVKIESITPVPEPETYAMLIAGLALMGFVARRRQRGLAVA
jgi:hypothetical protein